MNNMILLGSGQPPTAPIVPGYLALLSPPIGVYSDTLGTVPQSTDIGPIRFVADRSGNGYNFVQPSNDTATFLYDAVNGGMCQDLEVDGVIFNSAVSFSTQNFSIFMVVELNNIRTTGASTTGTYSGQHTLFQDTNGYLTLFWAANPDGPSTNDWQLAVADSSHTYTTNLYVPTSKSLLGITGGSGGCTITVNNSTYVVPALVSHTVTGLQLMSSTVPDAWAIGNVYQFAVYNSDTISISQMQAWGAKLGAVDKAAATAIYVNVGDSISSGVKTPVSDNRGWPEFIEKNWPGLMVVHYNASQPGIAGQSELAGNTRMFVPGATNVLSFMAGTNDIGESPDTGAEFYGLVAAYLAVTQNMGWYNIPMGILPLSGEAYNGTQTCNQYRNIVNTGYRNNYLSYGYGNIDVNTIPMGVDGANTVSTWYGPDNEHPNAVGCADLQALAAPIIQGVIAANPTTTYLRDFCEDANGTSFAGTHTLTSGGVWSGSGGTIQNNRATGTMFVYKDCGQSNYFACGLFQQTNANEQGIAVRLSDTSDYVFCSFSLNNMFITQVQGNASTTLASYGNANIFTAGQDVWLSVFVEGAAITMYATGYPYAPSNQLTVQAISNFNTSATKVGIIGSDSLNQCANLGFTSGMLSTPNFINASSDTIYTGVPSAFTFGATGWPVATISLAGTLPSGITFTSPVLSGTATGSGTFPLTMTATNSQGSETQGFTLTLATPTSIPFLTSIPSSASRTDGPYSIGYIFTVGPNPITVTALGRPIYTGNSQNHTVGIWNVANTTTYCTAVINASLGTPGTYEYSSITPVTLEAGGTYVIASSEGIGGSPDTWAGPSNPSSTGDVSYGAGYYNPTPSGGLPVGAFVQCDIVPDVPPNFEYFVS
jgi:lysophospholipase L1-like esterase